MQHTSAIYHAFDQTYKSVKDQIPELAKTGYKYIQLSPCQKSKTSENDVWWLRYQPIEFTIGNIYGSRDELIELVNMSHSFGVKVIADLALNFVASLEGVTKQDWNNAKPDEMKKYMQRLDTEFSQFTVHDFLPRTKIDKNGKTVRQWFSGELPALNTNTQKVRDIHMNYINDLISCGIDGFRWDAIKYMDPATLKYYLDHIPKHIWNYVETMEKHDLEKIRPYFEIADIEDFTWCQFMVDAFEGKGNITMLQEADDYIRKTDVTFSVNHDTFHRHLTPWFTNEQNAILATAFILAVKNGIPLILNRMANHEIIKTGVKFRKMMEDCDAPKSNYSEIAYVEHQKNYLIIERGKHGFCVINNNNKSIYIESLANTYLSGNYKNVADGSIIRFTQPTVNPNVIVTNMYDRPIKIKVFKKSALFYYLI